MTHADRAPLARDPACLPRLVERQLPTAGSLTRLLHGFVARAAYPAHCRRVDSCSIASRWGQLSALEGLIGRLAANSTSILAATNPQGGTLATIISLITLLIGATAVFGELQATLNLVWEVRPAPTSGVWAGIWAILRERLFSLALVLTLAFLLLVSLVISAALAGAAALFQGPEQAVLSRILEIVVSLLVLTFVFAFLYKYVPDAEIGWQDVWLGGLITAVLFTLGKTAIGFYLGQASVGSAYGRRAH